MKPALALPFLALALFADGPGRLAVPRARADFDLTANPDARHWRNVKGVWAEKSPLDEPTPANRFEIRTQWTDKHLYFLFVCPYQELTLKENPTTTDETFELWNWDVAEIFIGAEFDNIRRYREYQVSPQGEWVDLDINSASLAAKEQWKWNSGFTVKARIDKDKKIWYGEMKIPIASIDSRPPREGNEMRANFYRLSGKAPARTSTCWQPTGKRSHHVPESFGRIVLAK